VISVVGRIKPEKRAFSIIPLFDAWNDGKEMPGEEFPFIMDKNSSLHRRLFVDGIFNCRQYIPFENWEEKYAD